MKNLRRLGLIPCWIGLLFGCPSPTSTAPGPTSTAPGPDLVVSSIQVPSALQTGNATWTLSATVQNIGNDQAGTSTLEYQLSSKSTLDSTATLIGTDTIPKLPPAASYTDTLSTNYPIPQSATWYIFVTANANNQVQESNTSNNASSVKVYGQIVIETYQPVVGAGTGDTFISLFGASGDTTVDTPDIWNSNVSPYTVSPPSAIVESGSPGSPFWSKISCTLVAGTYYVRVRQSQSNEGGTPYAIRFLSLSVGDAPPTTYAYFNSPVTADTPDSDNPQSGGMPTNPVAVTIGSVVNSFIANGNTTPPPFAGDVDWYQLTLP